MATSLGLSSGALRLNVVRTRKDSDYSLPENPLVTIRVLLGGLGPHVNPPDP